MARDIYASLYYRKSDGLMPVRWMAPESMADGVCTHQTDVWSFGVLLWEIVTLGLQPYNNIISNVDVMSYVKAGGTMERPSKCPDRLYTLMKSTWNYQPCDRPNFQECLNVITELLNFELQNITFNTTSPDVSNSQDSWKTWEDSVAGRSQATTAPLISRDASRTTERTPKYLQLLHDDVENSRTSEYEIPPPSTASTIDSSCDCRSFSYQNLKVDHNCINCKAIK